MKQGTDKFRRAAIVGTLLAILFASVAEARQATLVRGPYLQSTAEGATTVVWNTDSAATGGLNVGRIPGGPWEFELTAGSSLVQAFTLTGLVPDAHYYYEVIVGGKTLASGPDYHFFAERSTNSLKPIRFVAWGDSGTGNGPQFDVASLLDKIHPTPDFGLGLGDLVYEFGAYEEYDPAFFTPYSDFQRKRMLWTSIGNHDILTDNGAPYLLNFFLPTDTGAPANSSGSELYYSFDVGMAHFVCLDLWVSSTSTSGPQFAWMVADLEDAVNRGKRWIIVFEHSPPYTKGTHDSDTENDLIFFRQNWVPAMESRGMDMLLAGHSHNYERSFLLKNDSILQSSTSEYSKIGSADGTIYIVNGSGKPQTGPLDHPLNAVGVGQISGLVVLDVSFQEIRGHFIEEDGSLLDEFVLRKSADTTAPTVREAWVPGPSMNRVRVAFSEPILAGSGSTGAELAANYSLGGGASVFGASLLPDNRTVELSTSNLTPGVSYVVTVNNVREASPGTLAVATDTRAAFMAPRVKSGVGQGETWRYFLGSSAPPSNWMSSGFNDASWSSGTASFGFGYSGTTFGTALNSMSGNASTLFLRKQFNVNDASAVTSMLLNIDYDDGFIAYLNGVEVERSNAPATPVNTGLATLSHSAKLFRRFEISKSIPKLVTGTNTLAIVGFNTTIFGNDFLLDPTLVLEGDPQPGNQPPLAVYEADANSGNVPITINFSSSNSSDSDGSIASILWLFGDGSPAVTTSSASHTYSAPGLYTVTLLVTDNQGAQSLTQESIFAHSVGQAPIAVLTANSTTVTAGGSISFDANSSSDPDGGPVTFAWDFGDPGSGSGNFSTSAAPSHVYSTAGTFLVTLMVTDDEGTQVTSTLTINAAAGGAPPPANGGAGDAAAGGGCWTSNPGENGESSAPLAFLLGFLALWTIWHGQRTDPTARQHQR